MDRTNASPLPAIVLLMVHAAITAATWRDIRHRPAAEVRGSKALWRWISAINTAGSLAYLLAGRRRPA